MIYILFSSDYEIFFGENLIDEREILIEPTAGLLATCEEIGVPMTLFADVACIWRYRELGVNRAFPDFMDDQLRSAIARGHDAELHLHPHWLTSTHDGRKWHMDESRFKLYDIGYRPREGSEVSAALALLIKGRDYLNDLLRPVSPSYRCVAFRAGGYAVRPGERDLLAALIAAGFVIDSSIVPGMVYHSNVNAIDFRNIPPEVNSQFGPRYGLQRLVDSGIFEIPIAAFPESLGETVTRSASWLVDRIARKARQMMGGGDGQAQRGTGIQNVGLLRRALSVVKDGSHFTLELSGRSLDVARMVAGTVKFIENNRGSSPDLFFSASCHPKEVYPSTLLAIRSYWTRIKERYGDSIQPITYQTAAALLTSERGKALKEVL